MFPEAERSVERMSERFHVYEERIRVMKMTFPSSKVSSTPFARIAMIALTTRRKGFASSITLLMGPYSPLVTEKYRACHLESAVYSSMLENSMEMRTKEGAERRSDVHESNVPGDQIIPRVYERL